MEFRDDIKQLIKYKHFDSFTIIQKKCIPLILQGKDVVGISATGTGKSHAFILPLLQMVDSNLDFIQAIIMAPTRELAIQLYSQINEITLFNPNLRIKLIASGKDKERMVESLNQQPHIIVGTIGRIKDLYVQENILRLEKTKIVVIDEADMTLELGFITDVDQICGKLSRKLQMVAFSATVPAQLQAFLKKYMHNPQLVEVKDSENMNPNVQHILINCRYSSYQEKLLKILPAINPYVCMIFAKTKNEVISTAQLLNDNNYKVIEIHGDLTNRERNQALRAIRDNQISYIVCSDIMARGLDIEGVTHVISLGLPSSLDYYTHRSGRTGRAGKSGISYVLYNRDDISGLKTLRNKFTFEYMDYKGSRWVQARPFDFKYKRKETEADQQIKKIMKSPVKAVKPGYKKKRQQEIENIRKREKRLMIQKSINEQKKERAKKAQREKGGY